MIIIVNIVIIIIGIGIFFVHVFFPEVKIFNFDCLLELSIGIFQSGIIGLILEIASILREKKTLKKKQKLYLGSLHKIIESFYKLCASSMEVFRRTELFNIDELDLSDIDILGKTISNVQSYVEDDVICEAIKLFLISISDHLKIIDERLDLIISEESSILLFTFYDILDYSNENNEIDSFKKCATLIKRILHNIPQTEIENSKIDIEKIMDEFSNFWNLLNCVYNITAKK